MVEDDDDGVTRDLLLAVLAALLVDASRGLVVVWRVVGVDVGVGVGVGVVLVLVGVLAIPVNGAPVVAVEGGAKGLEKGGCA